jgi:hypothetical protein
MRDGTEVVRLTAAEQRLDERPRGRARPVSPSDDAADQSALRVDEVGGGRPPYAIALARHVTALVEKDGRRIAAIARDLTYVLGLLPEAHQQDFQALGLELAVQPVDGR